MQCWPLACCIDDSPLGATIELKEALHQRAGKRTFIDRKGKPWAGPALDVGKMSQDGLVILRDGGKVSVYTTKGKLVYEGE